MGGGGGCHIGSVSVPVGTCRCVQWLSFSTKLFTLLVQSTGEKDSLSP